MSNPFRVFRGQLYAVGLKPDGDTISFKPHDAAAMAALPDDEGTPGKVSFDAEKNGAVSVRLQGIDALETHYQPTVSVNVPAVNTSAPKPSAGNHHQPTALARGSAHALLGMLGVTVTNADWHAWGHLRRVTVGDRVVTEKFTEGVEVVVVSDTCDRNGRVLGWVFPSTSTLAEGATLSEDDLTDLVKDSVNSELLNQGHAYPYYFFTLSNALRNRLSIFARSAVRYNRGVQGADVSENGVSLPTVSALNNNAVIWPYLYRKLLRTWRMEALKTWAAGGDVSPAALDRLPVNKIFESGDPYLYNARTKDFVRLSEVLTVQGDTLRLLVPPHELVFLA
jgi:endonuclease YncB( thermonuclease family)